MPDTDHLQAALLEEHWDALAAGRDMAPSGIDPALADLTRVIHRALRPPDPTPIFVAQLRDRVSAMATESATRSSYWYRRRWILLGIAGGGALAALSVTTALLLRSNRRANTRFIPAPLG